MDTLLNLGGQGAKPAAANAFVKDGSAATFMQDVIEASREAVVIVDFWAPWCGPCKTLGPLLEKLVGEAKGALRLIKINVEESPANQQLAAQMRIQSIPAVYAFYQGRPVDGFVGALPESQIRDFTKKLVGLVGGDDGGIADALEQAKQFVTEGDAETAVAIYQEVLAQEPENATAMAGYLRLLIQAGQTEQAKEILTGLPAHLTKNSEIVAVKTALELAHQATQSGPAAELRRAVAQNPDDHQARYDLALAYYADGEREASVEELLELFRRDRTWNDEAARKQLVKMFEAFGFMDPLSKEGRKRLSSMMFA